MPIALHSTRFGDLEIADADALDFPEGLVGLPGSRYALVSPGGEDHAFRWLQSLEDPELALPVTRPERFFPAYDVVLDDGDVPADGPTEQAEVWVVVRATERLEDFTVNLRAPLLLEGGRGWQVLNRAPGAELRTPLFGAQEATAAC
ncbi:flagellar assembly protein FliW [Patulibacter sp. SYSU D01012]|uniref:flagellar assembly protein FliW n=1 Tax=Patulibacter sp. SYSU D01012 TaxID=2817381 RepID=UPI001B304D69|nr:flagellar assembly protein FliW [Patulibacter sp. SYSU D01012]